MRSTPTGTSAAGGDEAKPSGSQQDYWPLTAYQRDIVAVSARYPDLPIAQAVAYARLDGTVNLDADARVRAANISAKRRAAIAF